MCFERAGKRNDVPLKIWFGNRSVPPVVIVTIPSVFCGAVANPMFHYRGHAAGVETARTVLHPDDVRVHHLLGNVAILAECPVDSRPSWFRRQIGLRRE